MSHACLYYSRWLYCSLEWSPTQRQEWHWCWRWAEGWEHSWHGTVRWRNHVLGKHHGKREPMLQRGRWSGTQWRTLSWRTPRMESSLSGTQWAHWMMMSQHCRYTWDFPIENIDPKDDLLEIISLVVSSSHRPWLLINKLFKKEMTKRPQENHDNSHAWRWCLLMWSSLLLPLVALRWQMDPLLLAKNLLKPKEQLVLLLPYNLESAEQLVYNLQPKLLLA